MGHETVAGFGGMKAGSRQGCPFSMPTVVTPPESEQVTNETDYILDKGYFGGLESTQNRLGKCKPFRDEYLQKSSGVRKNG